VRTLNRRKRREEEHEDEERWLITYADMITLLLAVFIVLYSFSVVDLKKFEAVAGALGDQFNGPTAGGGVLAGGSSLLSGGGAIGVNRAALVSQINKAIKDELPDRVRRNVSLSYRDGVVTVSVKADAITFPVGVARLTDEVRQILDVLGPSLCEADAPLLIEGHTCDLPISTVDFPSNWELSAQRATNVMVYMIRNCGISPDRICAVGYADTRPLKPNDSEASRARNRRVDIVVEPQTGDAGDQSRSSGASRLQGGQVIDRTQPVRLMPAVDLRARYYQHTGRRTVDAPATD
jgi:chemotaxis protein MotB